MMSNNSNQEEKIHLRDYVQIILVRKWTIITFFIVLVATVTIYTFKAVPIYQSTVQVLINQENPNVVSLKEVMALDNVDDVFYKTQLEILTSRSLARRVIKSLNLKDSTKLNSDKKTKNFSIVSFFSSSTKSSDTKNESHKHNKNFEESRLVDVYLSRLKVESIRNSRLINITFEGTHPEHITKIVNKHANEYIERSLEMRFAASQEAVEWLQKQLLEKKVKVEKAENTLQLYKEREKIVSLEDRQNIIVQKLEDLNTVLTESRTERIGLETLYNQAGKFSDKPDMIESIPNVMQSLLIQELKKDYINTCAEITKLSDRYGDKHPTMIKLASQAKEQKNRIKVEAGKIIKSIEIDYKVAVSKEKSLAKALEEQKQKALMLNRKAIAYGTLKRESESEKAMYGILLKRLKETDITGELKTSNINVVDYAEIPGNPIKPNKKLNIILAVIVGLGFGVGIAFFLEYLDNTIKSPEDVERYLGLPLLGVLEKVKSPKNKKDLSHEIITYETPRSTFAESVRNIRTNIMFTSTDNPGKLILITSTSQGEGKSFVAANLAAAFAQTGNKILLVDTDFRRPILDKIFNIVMTPGLSNHLIGECDLKSIIRTTNIPHLSVVTCGAIPPDPAEMLGSHSMEKFCKTVSDKFDKILFDTPPSMVVTDAIVLSNTLDATIFVVKSGETVSKVAKRAIQQITSKKRDVLGVVMNFTDISSGSYYYHYYSHYYKDGYGNVEAPKKVVETV